MFSNSTLNLENAVFEKYNQIDGRDSYRLREGDKIIATVELIRHSMQCEHTASLKNLVIEIPGVGVGNKLMNMIELIARQQKIKKIDYKISSEEKEIRTFCEKEGYTVDATTFFSYKKSDNQFIDEWVLGKSIDHMDVGDFSKNAHEAIIRGKKGANSPSVSAPSSNEYTLRKATSADKLDIIRGSCKNQAKSVQF